MNLNDGELVVIGAAGRTGHQLLLELEKRKVSARALVRSENRAAGISSAHRPVVADLADTGALEKAFAGAKVVHFIPPLFSKLEATYAANAINAAVKMNVERFVYHSVLHADTPDMPHHVRKAQVERLVRGSPLRWTVVQPAMYVTTPFLYFRPQQKAFRPPFSTTKPFNPVDTADLSQAVANVLLEDGHEFATYELAGANALTFRDMAAIASGVTKTTVEAVVGTADEALAGRDLSPESMNEARAMYAFYDQHGLPGNGRVLGMLLKRAPRSFERSFSEFIQRH
jgi:NAD(P)H dehydrogenase (quinone)